VPNFLIDTVQLLCWTVGNARSSHSRLLEFYCILNYSGNIRVEIVALNCKLSENHFKDYTYSCV